MIRVPQRLSALALAFGLFAAATSATALPQTARSEAPLPVRPVLSGDIIAFFQSRWEGSGSFAGSGRFLASSYEFSPSLGGEVLMVRHAERPPQTFAYIGLLSLDSVTQEVVMVMASNKAGGARLFRSQGWIEDKLVLEADPDLVPYFARERITFEKLDLQHFRATYEMSRDGVVWRVGDVQTFNRRD